MNIVDLPPDRAGDAVALWQHSALTRPWNDPHADLHRALSGPASTVLAALDDDVLVGTVMVGEDGHRGWVYYLAVHPQRRRAGIGTALMRRSEQWLGQRHVPKINLMIRTENAQVVAFYRSLGYDKSDVRVLAKALRASPDKSAGWRRLHLGGSRFR